MFAANLRLHQQDGLCHGKFNTPSSHIKDSKKKKKCSPSRFVKVRRQTNQHEKLLEKKTVLFYQTILLHRKVCHGDPTAGTSTQRVLFTFALQHNFLAYQT